jgi:hypothetical protein
MRTSTFVAGVVASILIGLGAAPVAHAQEGDVGWGGGRSAPASPTCPWIEWHVQPVGAAPATVNGVAFFSDMSGISMVKGAVAADGTITGTMTSVSGSGPAGTIAGKRTKQATHVELHGNGCSNVALNIYRYKLGASAGGF